MWGGDRLPDTPLRILGVDTSLRSTGYAVVEVRGSRHAAVEFGVVKCPAAWPSSRCLARLAGEIKAVVERARPSEAAVEGIFYCRNVRTAVVLGAARGVVMAMCAAAELPVYEYPPRQVKLAAVGHGAAQKAQVGRMMMAMLGLSEPPPEDAADALAIALCHAQHRGAARWTTLKAI